MPFDGSGNYVPPSAPAFPAISGTPISSTYYNSVINDISTALNNCLTRDGQGKPSAAINWNGQNLTGVNSFEAVSSNILGDSTVVGNFGVGGQITAGLLFGVAVQWARQTDKTIAAGAIAVTASSVHFAIDTEGAAAADDLTDITGGTSGQWIIVRGADAARVVTIKSSGNIAVPNNIILAAETKGAAFIYDGPLAKWVPVAVPYTAFTSVANGTVPASGGGTSNFLRADGTWAAPAAISLFPLTMNNGGAGSPSGTTFNGSVARTISYNTIGAVPTGAITTSGLTQATARLLGRTTGGTGAVEAISVGATLTLAAGSLAVASVPNSATFNNGGAGDASGTTYNGAAARTISYNTIGAAPLVPNVQSIVSAATITPTFSNDAIKVTALATNTTLNNPTGTAIDMWGIVIRIKDNGTARTIAYDTQYRAIGVTLPVTTVISKTLYLGIIYNNDDTKWDVVSVAQEA